MIFDVCLMNPPFGNRNFGGALGKEFMHHKFTEECLNISKKVCCIMPAKLCMYGIDNNKDIEHFKNIYDNKLAEVEEVDAKVFEGISIPNPGIHLFTNNNDGKIHLKYLNGVTSDISSLFDLDQFEEYEKNIVHYLKINDDVNYHLYQVEKNEEAKTRWFINLQKKFPGKIYLTANADNGGMNGTWFSPTVGNVFMKIDDLRKDVDNRKGRTCVVMTFNSEVEATNCRDAMKRPLLRFALYRAQDNRHLRSKVYKYIPNIDWSNDTVKTDEGLLQVCGCPEDKAKEYSEYCKKIIDEVDSK